MKTSAAKALRQTGATTSSATNHFPVDFCRRADLGQDRSGHPKKGAKRVVPLQRFNVHQHSSTGVGAVRDVSPTFQSTGEVPQEPRVHRAEHQISWGAEGKGEGR